jgi:putative oxidoreductase
MNVFTSLHGYSDVGLLALRWAIGAIFLVHGLRKRAMWSMKPSQQMPAGLLNILRLLSIAEPLGGLALVLGFLTQLAALGLAIVMVGAIDLKARKMKLAFSPQDTSKSGWEIDFILLAGSVALFFTGAGAYALDRLWFAL